MLLVIEYLFLSIKSFVVYYFVIYLKYLNTIIHFEEFKNAPMLSFIKLMNNTTAFRPDINFELLKSLQLQYSIDKSYFNN